MIETNGIKFYEYNLNNIYRQLDFMKYKSESNLGYVYIILCANDIIKIGKSIIPNNRLLNQISKVDGTFKFKLGHTYEKYQVYNIYISDRITNFSEIEAKIKQLFKPYRYKQHTTEIYKINHKKFIYMLQTSNLPKISKSVQKIQDKIENFLNKIDLDTLNSQDIIGLNINLNNVPKIEWKYSYDIPQQNFINDLAKIIVKRAFNIDEDNIFNDNLLNIELNLDDCELDENNKYLIHKELQKKGITKAKEKGVKFGRPPVVLPDNFKEEYLKWKSGEQTAVQTMENTNIPKSTFYKIVKNYKV